MANKFSSKLLAICQDDWGKRGGVAAWYHFARLLPGGRVLLNAQIAAGYALTLRLRHQWYLVTGTSAYGCRTKSHSLLSSIRRIIQN
jgi:hypothetical protein